MSSSNWIHIQVEEIIKVTERAFLCQVGEDQHWIPMSQINTPDDYVEGDKDITLSITEYIAKQLGLEEEGS